MKTTFQKAFQKLLQHEGGFVDHPKDPGGMTNLGVTRKNWELYLGHAVSEMDMRKLTPFDVEPFYRNWYWNKIKGDDLPAGVDYCVFDACVNSGAQRATKWLQKSVGSPVDGIFGPKTLAAAIAASPETTISAFSDIRLAFLKSLGTWDTFGKGWARRVNEVEKDALEMAK